MQQPETLTARDIARILRRTPRTISKRFRTGKFPGAFKDGKHWRVDKSDFLRRIRGIKEGM